MKTICTRFELVSLTDDRSNAEFEFEFDAERFKLSKSNEIKKCKGSVVILIDEGHVTFKNIEYHESNGQPIDLGGMIYFIIKGWTYKYIEDLERYRIDIEMLSSNLELVAS